MTKWILKMKAVNFGLVYMVAILLANLGFSYVPMIPLPGGEMFAPMSLLVGFIFIFRDLAQRQVGHKVLFFMGGGAILSYALADPFVAVASVVAFAVSEISDWIVFTISKRKLKERILISSAISTPIDSAIFMLMVGFFNWSGFFVMVASKMLGAAIVWAKLK